MKNLFLLLVIASFISCKAQQVNYIGSSFNEKDPISLSSALTDDNINKPVSVKAKVDAVCQMKGCWMTLTALDSNEEIFVKFKDYAFFMPLDLAGQNVIVDGIAYREVTSVDELRHYAEDEGKSPEEIAKITEPAEELKFMADGVIILK